MTAGHLRTCTRRPVWPTVIGLVVAVLAPVLGCCPAQAQVPTPEERQIIDAALTCPRATDPDPWLLLRLLRLEEQAGVPGELRGMVLAAACWESGYSATAIGDQGRAVGIVQLWPWARVDRRDPVAAARFWLGHVVSRVPRVERQCGVRGVKAWVAAWVTAIRAPKPGGRCQERPKHLRVLRGWREVANR